MTIFHLENNIDKIPKLNIHNLLKVYISLKNHLKIKDSANVSIYSSRLQVKKIQMLLLIIIIV